jgi:hypothetical protein
MMDGEGLVLSKRWKKTFGGFSRKGLTDLSLTTGEILQLDIWRIKNRKNYDTTTNYIVCATLMM